MDGTHRGIAILGRVHQNSKSDQVKNLVELMAADNHLLINRPVVLRPALYLSSNVRLLQILLNHLGDFLDVPVPLRRSICDQTHNLVVLLRVQNGEGEIFQLPLHAGHSQTMRQRCNHLEGLTGLLSLLFRRQEAHCAHVMQPVSHLDNQHARVLAHGDNHLSHGLCLGGGAQRDLIQFGHAVDQSCDFWAEVPLQVLQRVIGIFDRVM